MPIRLPVISARAALRNSLLSLLAVLPALAAGQQLVREAGVPAAPKKAPTVIDADVLEGTAGVEVRARGKAELKSESASVFAEFLRYNQLTGEVEADGGVRVESAGDRFFGRHFLYNLNDGTGVFDEPRYIIGRNNQTARGGADRLEFRGKDKFRLFGATFTTCAPGQEDWQLSAEELDLDYGTEEGRASNPRLKFFGTTVAALPFASFPLENRRKSGVLTPYYAQTTTRGFELGVPLYLNIAPEQDATFTPVYMSKRGMQLKSQYRYLNRDFRGDVNLEYLGDDQVIGKHRYGFTLLHEQRPSQNLYGRIDLNKVSDDRYFAEMHSQVRQVSQGNLQREGYLSYTGTVGDAGFVAESRVQSFQTLQDPLVPLVAPYHRVPQLNLTVTRNDYAGLLDARMSAEYVRFSHAQLVEGTRVSIRPTVSFPVQGAGFFLTPRVGLYNANYALDRVTPGQPERQTNTVPWGSVDTGLFFERATNWFGQDALQTLEPRAFYVYAPYVDQSQAPVFDTALADFNYAQIFNENRFVGGDRFGDANQLTLALSSRLLNAQGQEALRATIGQRIYFQNERVGLTPASTLRTTRNSDLLASVGGRITGGWGFDATAQYSVNAGQTERISASMQYSPEIAKVLNASYRFGRNALRQMDLSGQWPFATGWYGIGRLNYSFLDNRPLESIAGVEYNGGCWAFRIVVQHLQTTAQTSSTALFMQLELSGVGQIGSGSLADVLRRTIPGYAATTSRDPALAPSGLGARSLLERF
jgi:LPS-assembly protein